MAASLYVRAALIGLASGSRSQTGIAALSWSTTPLQAKTGRLSGALGRRWAKVSTGLAAAGELVGDKTPKAPPRTETAPLVGRLVLGAVSAYGLAEREGANRVLAALLGLAGAAATTFAGPKYRALAAAKLPAVGPLPRDLPGALLEDAFAIGTARVATR